MLATDRTGMLLSLLCVVHCAAMPLAGVYLPMLGLRWLADEQVHIGMAAAAAVLGGSAFVPGFLRHGCLAVPLLGVSGLGLLFWSTFLVETACPCCRATSSAIGSSPNWLESILAGWHIPLGGVLLMVAHLVNGRCCRRCHRRGTKRKP